MLPSVQRLSFCHYSWSWQVKCPKLNAHFTKFTACLWEGFICEWKHALCMSSNSLMSVNNSQFCSTQNNGSQWDIKLCILLIAQPNQSKHQARLQWLYVAKTVSLHVLCLCILTVASLVASQSVLFSYLLWKTCIVCTGFREICPPFKSGPSRPHISRAPQVLLH